MHPKGEIWVFPIFVKRSTKLNKSLDSTEYLWVLIAAVQFNFLQPHLVLKD